VVQLVSRSFADLDGDGDQDLILGSRDGLLRAFENTGTVSNPAYRLNSSWFPSPPQNLSNTVPYLADVNGVCTQLSIVGNN
jgi:hypothetical protein